MESGCMYGAFGVKCDFNTILPTVLVYSSLVIVYKNFSSFKFWNIHSFMELDLNKISLWINSEEENLKTQNFTMELN